MTGSELPGDRTVAQRLRVLAATVGTPELSATISPATTLRALGISVARMRGRSKRQRAANVEFKAWQAAARRFGTAADE